MIGISLVKKQGLQYLQEKLMPERKLPKIEKETN